MNIAQALGIAAAALVTSFADGVPRPLQMAGERAVATASDTLEHTPLRDLVNLRADAARCRRALY